MKSGCSESKLSATCSLDWRPTISCHQTSRSVQAVSCFVRCTTKTFSTLCLPLSASSTAGFNAKAAPFLNPPSAVITIFASAS